ncbi:amidase domain-containing protein [Clostridium sp.]|uniref:amidase domain-containing protein n=1 Tax=Clostridium sp. TaxID=1506 RepID=UPI00284B6675|nr:amidase domain-containing protein [Clostridium sp.]MDR3596255.1 amidase domain-containing protein [Clostridium sp.]
MLSKVIYDLCHLLSTPYNDLNSNYNNVSLINHLLLEKIYLDKLFNFKRRKSLNSIFENINFNYKYYNLEQNSKFIKLKLTLTIYFRVQNAPSNVISSFTSEYITILEHLQDKFKIQLLIENEENPILYNYFFNTSLSQLDNLNFYEIETLYKSEIPLIDSVYNIPSPSKSFSFNSNEQRTDSYFNISNACAYAEAFALDPNPNYKYFGGIGGDCANFISQIIHAGGISKTYTWTPYTNAWIRVENLYSYMIGKNLGTAIPNDSLLSKGCLIQFYTPAIGKYFHSGFITYKLPNNDCLYCCHSYNKLNYPLSEIYPNRYPKLRALKFY